MDRAAVVGYAVVELASLFDLQLVMAFPIDRLGVMAPYADTVVLCRKKVTPGP